MKDRLGLPTRVKMEGSAVHYGRIIKEPGEEKIVITICGMASKGRGCAHVVVGHVTCEKCLAEVEAEPDVLERRMAG